MIGHPFAYERPESLEQGLRLLAEHGPEAGVMAGGQDLVPRLSLGAATPSVIIDIGRLKELEGLRSLNGLVTLGSRVTHRRIARSAEVREHCGLLASAAGQIGGGPQVRQPWDDRWRGSGCEPGLRLPPLPGRARGDRPPRQRQEPPRGADRAAPARARSARLEPGELITEISVAAPVRGQRFTYEKLKFTDGCSLIVGVACLADVDDDGVVRSVQMAIGGATETPLRLADVESLVGGNAITLELLDAAAEETRRALAEPRSDVMADGAYRRRVARQSRQTCAGLARRLRQRRHVSSHSIELTVVVNGASHSLSVDTRMLLVDLVRDELDLTGTNIGCRTGHCGACTVVLDGEVVKSCTVLAASADGSEITTIEGVASNGELHPVQQAIWDEHGAQCGYCTPGMVLAAVELLVENASPTDDEIKSGLTGNLCRCTGIPEHRQCRSTRIGAVTRARGEADESDES